MYIHLCGPEAQVLRKEMTMKSRLLLVALTMTVGVLSWAEADKVLKHDGREARRGSTRPELEYLKAVNSVAPPQDPQLLFLLMGEFANANQQAEGAEFLSARLNEFACGWRIGNRFEFRRFL